LGAVVGQTLAAPASEAVADRSGPYRVSGTVIDALSGAPIVGALVTFRPAAFSSDLHESFTATSVAEGAFVTDPLRPGSYLISSESPGYIASDFGVVAHSIVVGSGIGGGELLVSLSPGASISGVLSDEDGSGISGALVTAILEFSGNGGKTFRRCSSGVSDGKGKYFIPGLTPGKYRLMASPPNQALARAQADAGGLALAVIWYPSVTAVGDAPAVEVRLGEAVKEVNITFKRTTRHSVSGRVDSMGAMSEVADSTVSILPLAPDVDSTALAYTKPLVDGSFKFENLAPGEYRIELIRSSQTRDQVDFLLNSADLSDLLLAQSGSLTLAGRFQTEDGDVSACRGARLGLTKAGSTLQVGSDTGWISGRDDGVFAIKNLEPAYYRISFSLPSSCYVAGVSYNGHPIAGRRIDFGKAGGELVATLRRTSAGIDGIIDSGMEALFGTAVLISEQSNGDGVLPLTVPISGGKFTFSGLEAGSYVLFAVDRYSPDIWGDGRFAELIASQGLQVRIPVNERVQVRALPLPYENVLRAVVQAGITSF